MLPRNLQVKTGMYCAVDWAQKMDLKAKSDARGEALVTIYTFAMFTRTIN